MPGLTDTPDAMVWSHEFCRIFAGRIIAYNPDGTADGTVDLSTMLSWFANAIETGRRLGRQETCPHTEMISITEDLGVCKACGMGRGLDKDDDPVDDSGHSDDPDDEIRDQEKEAFVDGFYEGREEQR